MAEIILKLLNFKKILKAHLYRIFWIIYNPNYPIS